MILGILNNELWFILPMLYSAFMAAMLVLVVVATSKKQFLNKKKENESYKLMIIGFKEHTIKTKEDVLLIYKSINSPIAYADYLENFILYVRKIKSGVGSVDIDIDLELFAEINLFVRDIINEERREKPFEGVDSYEKRLLNLIDEAAQCGEVQSVHNNLEDLAVSLGTYQRKIKVNNKLNWFTIPLSILSVILTIVTFWGGRTVSISQKDIDSITNINKVAFVQVLDSLQNLPNVHKNK